MGNAKRAVIAGMPVTTRIPSPAGGVRIETFNPWTLVKRGARREVITPIEAPAAFREVVRWEKLQREPEQHSPILRALGLAHYWQQLLDDGKFRSLTEIASAEGMDVGQVSRIGQPTVLAPSIVKACCAKAAKGLALGTRIRRVVPSDWQEQGPTGDPKSTFR